MQIAEPDNHKTVEQLRSAENSIEQFIDHETGKNCCSGTGDGDFALWLPGSGKNIDQRLRFPLLQSDYLPLIPFDSTMDKKRTRG